MCAMILVALIAAFAILVLAGIVALILFNPQARESNSEIEVLRQQIETLMQQVENLRTTVFQIQQSNASSSQGFSGEEISRQNIQESIIQELQMNISIHELEMKVHLVEQKIDNTLGNQSSAEITEVIIHKAIANVSKKFAQFELQLENTSEEIHFELEALSENVRESIKALQEEVQENNTAIQMEIEKLKTMLDETTYLSNQKK